MFWSKKSVQEDVKQEKLAGPRALTELVQKHLTAETGMDPVFGGASQGCGAEGRKSGNGVTDQGF